jgi:hypothetical protein
VGINPVLASWANAWVKSCRKYERCKHPVLVGRRRVGLIDSPVGYSERTLMAQLVSAWPFGPSTRKYRPLLAEFPVPALSFKAAKPKSRIPDLWFGPGAGYYVEGKVAWATVKNGRIKWAQLKSKRVEGKQTVGPPRKSLSPRKLTGMAERQLRRAGVRRGNSAPSGVVALFINQVVRFGESGDVPAGLADEVKALSSQKAAVVRRWSSSDPQILAAHTKQWSLAVKGQRRAEKVYYPVSWLVLYKYAPASA